MRRPAPACPECGGVRYWYGSIEFWVGGTSHGPDDQLNAAVCGNCGYSSLYLQNMAEFRQVIARISATPPTEGPVDAPDRSEIKAFRRAIRQQKKSERS